MDPNNLPKMMTKAEVGQFIDQLDQHAKFGDVDGIKALLDPVHEAMAFGGFKSLFEYLTTCMDLNRTQNKEGW